MHRESRLTPEEQETIVQFDMRSATFTITTVVRRHISRLTKRLGKGQILDRFGTTRWSTPVLPTLR